MTYIHSLINSYYELCYRDIYSIVPNSDGIKGIVDVFLLNDYTQAIHRISIGTKIVDGMYIRNIPNQLRLGQCNGTKLQTLTDFILTSSASRKGVS